MNKPLLVSSGEPAGIGPDICLELASCELPIVVLGDKGLLSNRARQLGLTVVLEDYQDGMCVVRTPNYLTVLSVPCAAEVIPGMLDSRNATYVIELLTMAVHRCLKGEFSALITAPVHKAIINQAGFSFIGHTEFLAEQCRVKTVVMMLACRSMKVALVTTHLPLREVADAITDKRLTEVITCLHTSLRHDFGISHPKIHVAGLNPHAGEGGYLGHEEMEIISPTLALLKKRGINVHGPIPADTLFNPQGIKQCDALVVMYHDQGLPVLKYVGFGQAVNITLGLPIVRTSVDHGTAIELAGSNQAEAGSLFAAVEMAANIVKKRENRNELH